MANFLFIDTAASVATIALSIDGSLLTTVSIAGQTQQAAALNRMIGQVLEEAEMGMERLDAYCICAGPGSYTGLRVGMSTAKGMAYALNKKLICFNRLQLIALSFPNETREAASIGVLQKARKGEYFLAVFDREGAEQQAPQHIMEPVLEEKIKQAQVIITDTDGVPALQKNTIVLPDEFTPDRKQWLRLAQQKWEEQDFADIAYVEPFYLKPAFTTTPKKKI